MSFDNPFNNPNAGPGAFKPQFRPSSKLKRFVCVDPTRAGEQRNQYPVPLNTRFIWDTRVIFHGFARMVKGHYAETLAPLGMPEPELPSNADPAEWQPVAKSQVWVDAFDERPGSLRQMSITGIIAMNAMAATYKLFGFHKEAQQGQLGVFAVHEFTDVETSYGIFGAPMLELVGFADRDDNLFGPPLIPPPSPILGTSYVAPPQLASSGDNDNTPPPAPVRATPETKPVDDPLRRFRPVPAGTGRRPY
jgi:hypothetical protein